MLAQTITGPATLADKAMMSAGVADSVEARERRLDSMRLVRTALLDLHGAR